MTSFRRMFLASFLSLLLLAIPFIVGAEDEETHRIFFSEDDTARNGGVAEYGMIQLDELETVAGRQDLDQETIQFLEDNLWLPELTAKYANVGGLEHIGLCQGEGLLDTANQAAFVESVGPISLYCSPRARFAAYGGAQLLPVGDAPGDQIGFY